MAHGYRELWTLRGGLATQVFGEEALDAFPGIFGRLGAVRVRVVVAEEGVARVGIDDDLMRCTLFRQDLVELLDGALGHGLILVAVEAEDRGFEVPELV